MVGAALLSACLPELGTSVSPLRGCQLFQVQAPIFKGTGCTLRTVDRATYIPYLVRQSGNTCCAPLTYLGCHLELHNALLLLLPAREICDARAWEIDARAEPISACGKQGSRPLGLCVCVHILVLSSGHTMLACTASFMTVLVQPT